MIGWFKDWMQSQVSLYKKYPRHCIAVVFCPQLFMCFMLRWLLSICTPSFQLQLHHDKNINNKGLTLQVMIQAERQTKSPKTVINVEE